MDPTDEGSALMAWIVPHVEAALDFDRYGGKERVRATLGADEMILQAQHGSIAELAPSGDPGKQHEGLLAMTNRRVLVVRSPGLLRKDPAPISILFEAIGNCGPHKSRPNTVVVVSYQNHQVAGYHMVLATGGQASDPEIWGFAIRQSAEAAGGPENMPPSLR